MKKLSLKDSIVWILSIQNSGAVSGWKSVGTTDTSRYSCSGAPRLAVSKKGPCESRTFPESSLGLPALLDFREINEALTLLFHDPMVSKTTSCGVFVLTLCTGHLPSCLPGSYFLFPCKQPLDFLLENLSAIAHGLGALPWPGAENMTQGRPVGVAFLGMRIWGSSGTKKENFQS